MESRGGIVIFIGLAKRSQFLLRFGVQSIRKPTQRRSQFEVKYFVTHFYFFIRSIRKYIAGLHLHGFIANKLTVVKLNITEYVPSTQGLNVLELMLIN